MRRLWLQAICRYYRSTFLAAAAAALLSVSTLLLSHCISLHPAPTGLYAYQVSSIDHLARIANTASSDRCGLLLQMSCLSVIWLSVCVLVTLSSRLRPAKMAEAIEMPFGRQTRVGWRNHVLDEGIYERHLANTIERSVVIRAVARPLL